MQSQSFSEPRSYLGRIVLSSRTVGGAILIPIKAYFDGSHPGDSGWELASHIALAGFAVGDDLMKGFEDDWQAALDDDRYRPKAPYLHMKLLRSDSRKSPFSKSKGWNNERRARLVYDLVEVLTGINKQKSHYFACGVDAEAVRKRQRLGRFPSAIRICTHYCPHYVLAWYAREYPGIVSSMNFFFDLSEPFYDDFKELRVKQIGNCLETSANRESWSLLKTITEVSTEENQCQPAALQAADLLAWGTLRQMKIPESSFLRQIAVIAKRAVPSSWSRWDDSNLDEVKGKVPF